MFLDHWVKQLEYVIPRLHENAVVAIFPVHELKLSSHNAYFDLDPPIYIHLLFHEILPFTKLTSNL